MRIQEYNEDVREMRQCLVWLFWLLMPTSVYTHDFQYMYPVACATSDGQTSIYCVRQTSADAITLHVWNPITHADEQVLDEHYRPASLTLMPDNQGFSFIDNGRIRICKQQKSPPETLALTMPLYDISLLHWIDQYTLYCSAKKRMRYGIFAVDRDGHVTQLLYSITADYMYPHKIGSDLFYIERSDMEDGSDYEIVHTKYAHKRLTECSQVVADFGKRPLIFLHMATAQEGFVIEYPFKIAQSADRVTFTCHRIQANADGQWGVCPLFTFTLPIRLFSLHCPEKLYESLLPLMPCYDTQYIYFVHESPQAGSNLYAFCKDDGSIQQKTWVERGQVVCGARVVNNTVWYGGSLGINLLT